MVVADTFRASIKSRIIRVPRGETLDNWTRKLTVFRYATIAFDREGLREFATQTRRDIISDCPDGRASEIRFFDWAGRPSAEFHTVCPRDPETGRPDIYLLRMIGGVTDYLSAAVSFRTAPSDADLAQAGAWLDSLYLCTATGCRRSP